MRELGRVRGRGPRIAAAVVLLLSGACGDGGGARDAGGAIDAPGPDAYVPPPGRGPLVELPLLPDYNHSSEASVAAWGDDVVVVSINQKFDSPDTFEYPGAVEGDEFRRVAFSVSHDRGQTFQAPYHLGIPESTDPVVRVAQDGTYWATLLTPFEGTTTLATSTDGGTSWTVTRSDLLIDDKPWLAVDSTDATIYVAGNGQYYELAADGGTIAGAISTIGMSGAWADGGVARFLDVEFLVTSWDGSSSPREEGSYLPPGDAPRAFTFVAGSIGETGDGREWILRAMRSTDEAPIVIRVRRLPDDPGEDVPLTGDGAVAFIPAGTLDSQGRLHAVWYDSSGPTGRLMYTHSLTADLTGAYEPAVALDPNACPGDGWYPYSNRDSPPKPDEPGGRRLREYIDIATADGRAHVVWTHAPEPPSRVYTTYIDYE